MSFTVSFPAKFSAKFSASTLALQAAWAGLILIALCAGGASRAWAEDPSDPPASGEEKPEDKDKDGKDKEGKDEDEAGEKKPDRFFAVHAGQVYTVSGGVLRDVTILSKNGQITAIGRDLVLPEQCEVLDAKAYRVYPGLIASNSFGIVGSDPANSTDVFSLEMAIALSTGITTVGTGNTVAKLTWGTLEGHVLGSRPLTVRLNLRGGAAVRKLRTALDEVVEFRRKVRANENAVARGEKPTKLKPLQGNQAMFARLLSGEVWAYAQANSRAELALLAELALQYGFRATIEGGAEGWTLAPLLSRAGCRVVVVPRARQGEDSESNRESGWSIENAARLHAHGVPVAIMSKSAGIGLWGLAGSDLFTLPLEAGFAVRGGLPEAAALEALTLNPARFMGIEDRVGSIEVGKDCDLVIARGDILHYETLPEWTVVNGRVAYDKQKDSLLRHVRAREIQGQNLKVPLLWPRAEAKEQPKGFEDE